MAYDATWASGTTHLLAPARALLMVIGQEIIDGMSGQADGWVEPGSGSPSGPAARSFTEVEGPFTAAVGSIPGTDH